MILSSSHTPDWIASKRAIYKSADQGIMERVTYALKLVELLVLSGLQFVLKGGTSLLLILPEPKRFSIDVDIVTIEKREKIETILKTICNGQVFQSFDLDDVRSYNEGIPKAHYRINYNSDFYKSSQYILLDILYEQHGYHELKETPIKNEWLQIEGKDTIVKVPSINSLVGDKLTAFAPNTIGIPYKDRQNNGKQMEVMKQLFDVGILFDQMSEIIPFRNSFDTILQKEIAYRESENFAKEQVLNDIIDTSLIIASRGRKLDIQRQFPEIQIGLRGINSFIYNGAFRIDEAIISSSKAAYLSAVLLSGYEGEIHRWQVGDDILKYRIQSQEYNFLNRLTNIPGGSLYHWHQALALLKKI